MVLIFILAPALATRFGWQSVWWFSAGFALLAFGLVWLFMHMPPGLTTARLEAGGPPPGEVMSLGKAVANRNIWYLAASFGFFNMALIAISTFYPTFLSTELDYSMASASFTSKSS